MHENKYSNLMVTLRNLLILGSSVNLAHKEESHLTNNIVSVIHIYRAFFECLSLFAAVPLCLFITSFLQLAL